MNKILLIDDEIEILDILTTVLEMEGFKYIYRATSGKEGIELFKKYQKKKNLAGHGGTCL